MCPYVYFLGASAGVKTQESCEDPTILGPGWLQDGEFELAEKVACRNQWGPYFIFYSLCIVVYLFCLFVCSTHTPDLDLTATKIQRSKPELSFRAVVSYHSKKNHNLHFCVSILSKLFKT